MKFYGGGGTPQVPQLTIHQLIAAVDGLPGKIPIHMAGGGYNVPWVPDRHTLWASANHKLEFRAVTGVAAPLPAAYWRPMTGDQRQRLGIAGRYI